MIFQPAKREWQYAKESSAAIKQVTDYNKVLNFVRALLNYHTYLLLTTYM